MINGPRYHVLILGPVLAFLPGCWSGGGSSSSSAELPQEQIELLEVGEMYRIFIDDNKRPARSAKDLMKYATAFTSGSMALQEGKLVVTWGEPLEHEEGTTEILAFEKKALAEGGPVLMRDGTTIKSMTAEELKAVAPPDRSAASGKKKA